MAAPSSRAMQRQLAAIMAALTTAAVAEICELVDEGYAELQLEIRRSRRENEDLKQKLHLIESIVGRAGGKQPEEPQEPEEPEVQPEEPEVQREEVPHEAGTAPRRDRGAAVLQREELPDVVLIKDEDSDSHDSFEEDNKPMAVAVSTPVGRSVKRRWPGHEETDKQSSSEQLTLKTSKGTGGTAQASVVVYTLDSPRSEPGCSGQYGGEELKADSSHMDPDVHLVHQESSMISPTSNRQTYFGSSSLMESPTSRAEMDLSLTWSKHSQSQTPFPQFHQNENVDGDAFGLKLISVSGSTSTDCHLSESSNSVFEYEDADMMTLALYRDPSGASQAGPPPGSDCSGKRFICSICSKTYATSQNLEVHMRIHTGVRPFICCQCGKKFTQSAHLKSHLSVHSGERPYACTLCSRSFIVKYSLKLHMKKCHPTVKGNECDL